MCKKRAITAIRELGQARQEFTADDVHRALGAAGTDGLDGRVLGGCFLAVQETGLITKTPTFRESVRPVCHRRPMRVWRGKTWQEMIHDACDEVLS